MYLAGAWLRWLNNTQRTHFYFYFKLTRKLDLSSFLMHTLLLYFLQYYYACII